MAESNSGGSATPWLAFLVGIVVVALLVVGFYAFGGAQPQRTAELNINTPQIETPKVNPPDLPDVNPPAVQPPASNPAPASSGQ
ncbi:MAG TPA: hypothetical protein VG943_13410 [Caulobacterales bacterium]|nr:hypothetical protein [Caulobacterales bacterium]